MFLINGLSSLGQQLLSKPAAAHRALIQGWRYAPGGFSSGRFALWTWLCARSVSLRLPLHAGYTLAAALASPAALGIDGLLLEPNGERGLPGSWAHVTCLCGAAASKRVRCCSDSAPTVPHAPTLSRFTASIELLPMRAADMDLANAPRWVARGYDAGDVARFLVAYQATTANVNQNTDLKIRLSQNVS